eukprot:CAMPEP_0196586208 /NCGR_PEP_ID=MMETSP1081-20130531/53499_1 /TAXON_ID=36882 /ORGANISM="Pyramimonas amylifera, Strain CCMP720" /LENGTH=51 /DNA_ID=CAMNT_0041908007 /DNA_START=48 /DNA_END=203 /DNA_ORIENTATION=-
MMRYVGKEEGDDDNEKKCHVIGPSVGLVLAKDGKMVIPEVDSSIIKPVSGL